MQDLGNQQYFNLLNDIFEEFDFKDHPERVCNMDEHGVPLDPKPPKVLAAKGQKKVRYRCAGAKGQVTVLGCCSATGQALPPFVIFDAKQLNYEWTRGEVPGTQYGLSDTGWTNKTLFHGWLVEHFLVHAVQGRPLLLLVDGHSSHYDPETIRFAKEHNVIIFCLPPHTTHEAQPLDVSFFGPLKTNWGHVCHDFYQSAAGRVVTKYNFSELFAKAWMKTCTPAIICAGFRRAGIIPFDPERVMQRFPESDDNESMDVVSPSNAMGESSEVTPEPSRENSIDGSSEVTPEPSSENSTSESSKVTQAPFSKEEEELYCRRFEEGYDLHDDRYELWLSIVHPVESTGSVADSFVSVEPATPSFMSASPESPPNNTSLPMSQTPPSNSSSNSSSRSSSGSSSTPSSDSSSSSPLVENTPPSVMSPILFPSPVSPVPETPPTNSVSPSVQCRSPLTPIANSNLFSGSPLNQYLTPVPKDVNSHRRMGRASVLTSKECLDMLEEKQRKKKREAEEKEERKKERERQRVERVEQQRKKKEERLEQQRKKIERLERQRKLEEAKKKQQLGKSRPKRNLGKHPSTNPCSSDSPSVEPPTTSSPSVDPPLQGTTSTPSVDPPLPSTPGPSVEPPATSSNSPSVEPPLQRTEEACECAFCYGNYCSDGEEWVKCACCRWVHESCMEEVYLDENGEE